MNSRTKPSAAATQARLSIWVVLMVVGCAPRTEQANVNTPSQLTAPAVSLRITDADGYRQTLAKHRGNVVLVDFWATWCLPCLEQFPHTVTLHRKYRDRGLVVISVALNTPTEEPQVRKFLEQQDAHFDNLLSKYGGGTEAIKAFGLPGPVPYYRIYDRSGELRHEFMVDPRAVRQFTPADIEAAVIQLL